MILERGPRVCRHVLLLSRSKPSDFIHYTKHFMCFLHHLTSTTKAPPWLALWQCLKCSRGSWLLASSLFHYKKHGDMKLRDSWPENCAEMSTGKGEKCPTISFTETQVGKPTPSTNGQTVHQEISKSANGSTRKPKDHVGMCKYPEMIINVYMCHVLWLLCIKIMEM